MANATETVQNNSFIRGFISPVLGKYLHVAYVGIKYNGHTGVQRTCEMNDF